MEREKIMKALECFTSVTGLAEWTLNCFGCYFETQGLCEQHCSRGLADVALALIKELTEENERLQAQKETLEIVEKDLRFRNKELQKANEGLAKNCEDLEDQLQSACEIKADTVREMQERLNRELRTGYTIMDKSISEVVGRVSEEMLKGEEQ